MWIKKGYCYLFYKLYKFSEAAPSKWLSDWKASLSMDILMLFAFSTMLNYYKALVNQASRVGEGYVLFVVIIIVSISNYFIFQYKDQWRNIVHDFDGLSKKKNKMGSCIVFGIVFLIVFNFIFSFYLYYQV